MTVAGHGKMTQAEYDRAKKIVWGCIEETNEAIERDAGVHAFPVKSAEMTDALVELWRRKRREEHPELYERERARRRRLLDELSSQQGNGGSPAPGPEDEDPTSSTHPMKLLEMAKDQMLAYFHLNSKERPSSSYRGRPSIRLRPGNFGGR